MPHRKWVIKAQKQMLYYAGGGKWSRYAHDALMFDDFQSARRFGLDRVTKDFKIINIMLNLPQKKILEDAFDQAMKGVI